MNIYNKKRSGFTLIELLIVIAIIGILATIIIVSLVSAQQKAKDTKIESNVNSIDTGLAEFYTDNTAYPTSSLPGGDPVKTSSSLASALSPTYITTTSVFDFSSFAGIKATYLSTGPVSTQYILAAGLLGTYKPITAKESGNGYYAIDSTGHLSISPFTGDQSTLDGLAPAGGTAFVVYGPQ